MTTVTPAENSRAAAQKKLAEVTDFLSSWPRSSDVLQLIMEDESTHLPFLVLLSTKPDTFLRDQAATRLSVTVDDDSRAVALLHAYNRELREERELEDLARDLTPMLEDLCGEHLTTCAGFFDSGESQELFSRVRKSDLHNLLIEKYDGKVLFRARSCSFLVDCHSNQDEQKESRYFDPSTHCVECRRLFVELDAKYCGGRLCDDGIKDTKEEEDEIEVKDVVRRGRPKTGRRKQIFGDDFVSPDAAIEATIKKEAQKDDRVEEDKEEEEAVIKGEDLLAMEDDPTDEDYGGVRKSMRKRKLSVKVNVLPGKRKRGRPPNLTDHPVSCSTCGETFIVAKDYKQHCLEHTNNFPCDFEGCTKRFKAAVDLEVHLRKHRGENPYVCSECDEAFPSKPDFKLHLKTHSGPKPFPCDQCPKTFARIQQRDIHMVVHTGERAYLCSECGNSFGSVSTLIDHRKRKHLEMRDHKCSDCTKGFFTRQELEAHVRTHTGDKPFLCTICGKNFARTHHLKRHIESVHKGVKASISNKNVIVKEEEDQGSSTAILKLQESLSGDTVYVTTVQNDDDDDDEPEGGGERTLLLSEMNGQLLETEYLVDGQRYTSSIASDGTPLLIQKLDDDSTGEHHSVQYATLSGDAATSLIELSQMGATRDESSGDGTTETVVVEIPAGGQATGYILLVEDGNQKLVPVSEYQRTMEKASGRRPFACDNCDKTFLRKSGLRVHITSVHEHVKSLQCEKCGAAFKSNSALIDHRKRVHLQVKPHCCEHCGKHFFSKKDYSEHVRTHTGEKPFQCQSCGKQFGRQNHLKRHAKVHKLGKVKLEGLSNESVAKSETVDSQPNLSDEKQTIVKALPANQ